MLVTAAVNAGGWDRTKPAEYDLVIIDEAHHIFRDELLRDLVMQVGLVPTSRHARQNKQNLQKLAIFFFLQGADTCQNFQ